MIASAIAVLIAAALVAAMLRLAAWLIDRPEPEPGPPMVVVPRVPEWAPRPVVPEIAHEYGRRPAPPRTSPAGGTQGRTATPLAVISTTRSHTQREAENLGTWPGTPAAAGTATPTAVPSLPRAHGAGDPPAGITKIAGYGGSPDQAANGTSGLRLPAPPLPDAVAEALGVLRDMVAAIHRPTDEERWPHLVPGQGYEHPTGWFAAIAGGA